MQIDWLTVGAQIVNFLVLVWLLRRFLYGPIIRAMARRESRIETRLSEAKGERSEAAEARERLEAARRELEDAREEKLEAAREEAAELRERLERELREEIDAERDAWRERLDNDRARFLQALRKRAGAHAHRLLRDLLAEFADTDLSERVTERFAERLRGLDDDTRARLAQAAEDAGGAARVETDSPLPSQARGSLTRVLHTEISSDLDVTYETADDLGLGLRLTIGGRSLEWSADAYLDRLKARVEDELDALRREAPSARADTA